MVATEPNLVLTGFMGTGKSTVGQCLAERMNRRLLDMDAEIERREECSIAEIFRRRGEKYFRDCESRLSRELSRPASLVVAAGGGIVLDRRNVEWLRQGGILICLWASPATLAERLANDNARPLLSGTENAAAGLRQLLAEREPLYRQLALRVDTDGRPAEQVADRVFELYRRAHRDFNSQKQG